MSASRRSTSGASGARATAVLLEDIRAQNRCILEAIHALGEKMGRDLAAFRTELSERMSALDEAVRENSKDIRKNSDDIIDRRAYLAM